MLTAVTASMPWVPGDNPPFPNLCAVRAAYRFRAAVCRLKRIFREMPDMRQARRKRSERENAV